MGSRAHRRRETLRALNLAGEMPASAPTRRRPKREGAMSPSNPGGRMPMTLSVALATVACAAFVTSSLGARTVAFTRSVSPPEQTNATEPAVDVDRSDGTVWAAWQGGGTHVARSDDGGRTWLQTPINDKFGSDVGDVDVAVGGPTPCAAATATCLPNTHRVYVSSL